VKKYLQFLKDKKGMSAERRAQQDANEKEEKEGRSLFLMEKLIKQMETRNQLAAESNELRKKAIEVAERKADDGVLRTKAFSTYVSHFEKLVSVGQVRS
jgi:hypothetical protein